MFKTTQALEESIHQSHLPHACPYIIGSSHADSGLGWCTRMSAMEVDEIIPSQSAYKTHMRATALSGTLQHDHDVSCIHLSKTRYGRCIAATREVWRTSFCVYSWCRLCQTMLSQRP